MADIFLSYAREDRDRAEMLAHALESRGWSVWWDRRIQAGHSFADVIEKALEDARCVVVLWTEHSIDSNWVQNEATEGDHRTSLIPVRLDDVRIPLGFRHLQTADLLGWEGEQSPELAEFLSAVESKLGQPVAGAAAAPVSRPRAPERKSRVGLITTIAIAAIALLGVLIAIATRKAQLTRTTTTALETSAATTSAEATTTTTTAVTDTATTTSAPSTETSTTTAPTATTTAIATFDPHLTATLIRPDIRPLPTRTYVDLETTEGRITIECLTDRAPRHTNYFLGLARRTRFDGTTFTRVAPGMFAIAGTDVTPITFGDENLDMPYQPGLVAFGNDGQKETRQLFFCLSRRPPTRQSYSWFGRVVSGMDVVDRISRAQVGRDRRPVAPVTITKATTFMR